MPTPAYPSPAAASRRLVGAVSLRDLVLADPNRLIGDMLGWRPSLSLRAGLEKTSCECYAIVKERFDAFLEPPPTAVQGDTRKRKR